MASTDARPLPRKNTAYRVTFPIFDADGDLVTGATALDSEISGDGGTFADCTNEATEIATSSGMYYLDLTAGEMNYDTVSVIVKTSSSGAKTTPLVIYPEELGDVRVDVGQISGDATAADNAESFFDGTGYAGTNNVIPLVTLTTTTTNLTNERGKYADGAVWIGPTANTNTTSYTDGIITNPVSTIAAAKTIADALLLRRFHIIRTGTAQIGADMVGYNFTGAQWSLTTTGGSRDVSSSSFRGALVTGGTFASTSAASYWELCEFATGVSIAAANMWHCSFAGTTTLSAAGNYDFIDCASVVAGSSTPIFAVPAGTVNISFRRWSGGISITGITSATTISIDMVSGGTVTLAGADGNVQIRGMVATITDNRTGTPTLGQNAAINITKINTEADTALTDYAALKPTVSGRTLDVSATGEADANVTQWRGTTVPLSPDGLPVTRVQALGYTAVTNLGDVVQAGSTTTSIIGTIDMGNQVGSLYTDTNDEVRLIIAQTGTTYTLNRALSFSPVAASFYVIPLGQHIISEIQSGLSTLTQANVRTAVGLASANLDTQLDALPTNAELATALGTADDAVLAAIAALNNPSTAAIASAVAALVIETGYSLTQTLQLIAAATAGKLSGAATTTNTIRNLPDTANRIVATVDADGNRTAVTHNV